MHVDGHAQGNVKCDAAVSIGREGRFEGEIRADQVLISGTFEGTIDARRLEIVAGGQVSGTVEIKEFIIESGGQFNGSSRIKDETPRQLSHQPPEPKPGSESKKKESEDAPEERAA